MAAAQEPTYVQHENVVYGEANGVGLVMDVFTPKGAGNGLGIVDVVSGAWHSDRGKIHDHTRAQVFQILCNKGYTVFAIRPGSVTKFDVLEMLAHVNVGIRWVKDHADSYKIDPHRLGLIGASAGGHLACLAAVTATTGKAGKHDEHAIAGTDVKAVAVFFPPTDFLDFGGKAIDARVDDAFGQVVRRLAFPQGLSNASDAEVSDKLKQISPARLVTRQAPPFLLVPGGGRRPCRTVTAVRTDDRRSETSRRFRRTHREKGGGHPWLTLHEEVQVLADWFDRRLETK